MSLIEITNETPIIQPNGIKLELYLHQKVLVQKILNIMEHKLRFYDTNDVLINNKNIWLKSSIGTGKSLILLSVIQELKNKNFSQIDSSKVPIRNSLLYMVEHYDRNMNINYLSKDCFYYKLLNSNIYRMEMNKMQGYYVEGHKKILVNYPSFRKQALIFCQHQVIDQFEEYITTQTSLTFKSIKDGTSFIEYALSDKSFDEVDVILYDTNQLEPQVYLTNAASYIKLTSDENQPEDKQLSESIFNSKIAQIQQRYKNVQSFNDFWQTYQNIHQNKPYALIAFDDFDLIKFPNHFPLESVWNVFVGSTMIKMSLQNSNVCANFIMNKFIHDKTSLRIKEDQIQQILKLPKCTYENTICYTPNQVYVQFKGLLYLQTVFQLIQKVFIPASELKANPQAYATKQITLEEYEKILANQLSFYDVFDQYLLQYKLPFKQPNGQTEIKQILNPKQQYSVWYLIDYIEYMKQLYEMNLLCAELKQHNLTNEQIQEYVNETFSLLSEPLTLFIANCPQETLDVFFNNLQRYQFEILQEEIDANKLFNPFTNHQDLDTNQLVVCRCCGQLFNEKDIDKALFYEEGKLKCSFCMQYINDSETQFLKISTQRYIKFEQLPGKKVQFSEKLVENLDISPISKDQILLKQLKENKFTKKRVLLYSNNINNLGHILQKEVIKTDDVYKELISKDDTNLTPQKMKEYFLNLFQEKFYKILNYGQINNFKNIIFQNIKFTTLNIIKGIQNQVFKHTDEKEYHQKEQQLIQVLQAFLKEFTPEEIDNTADIILVQSLDQIIGANITYIDVFIFYDVPQTTEEIYQVIGRSRRIGRRDPIQSYQYYYPLSKKLKLDL